MARDIDGGVTIVDYLERLSELMLATEVFDREGCRLTIEEGARRAVELIVAVKTANLKIMLAGNGGSSAIVSHAQSDLSAAVGVRSLVFTDTPMLTANANDFGYPSVFERPIELWAEPGDLLYIVSSSGQSENIVKAINAALHKGCKVITLSGFSENNPAKNLGDLNFYVRSDIYGFVECAHTAITHFLAAGPAYDNV